MNLRRIIIAILGLAILTASVTILATSLAEAEGDKTPAGSVSFTLEDAGCDSATGGKYICEFSSPFVETTGELNLHYRPQTGDKITVKFNGIAIDSWNPPCRDFCDLWESVLIPSTVVDQGTNTLEIITGNLTVFSDSVITLEEVIPDCTLDLDLSYVEDTLNIDFLLGAGQPAFWNVWLVAPTTAVRLWSAPIPVINPAEPFPVPIPGFPAIGKVGVLTWLADLDGIKCWTFATVNTGKPPGAIPSAEELRNLLPESNGFLRRN